MNSLEINLIANRKDKAMNRYTETVYRPQTRIKWGLLASDIALAIATPVMDIAKAVRAAAQSIARKVQIAGVAACVGAAIAVETYRLMA